jgi:hypothetical protein
MENELLPALLAALTLPLLLLGALVIALGLALHRLVVRFSFLPVAGASDPVPAPFRLAAKASPPRRKAPAGRAVVLPSGR